MDEAGSQGLAGWLRLAFRHYLILLPYSVSTRWDREQEPRFRQSAVVVSDLSNLQPGKLVQSRAPKHPARTFDVAGGYGLVALKSRNNWPRSSGAFVGIFDLPVLFGIRGCNWHCDSYERNEE